MMLDANVVACSPASVYRVLLGAGLLAGHTPTPTKKGTGFVQPLQPHEHGHVDVSYLNIAGTFYFLCYVSTGQWPRDAALSAHYMWLRGASKRHRTR
jgi:hypothetical protein